MKNIKSVIFLIAALAMLAGCSDGRTSTQGRADPAAPTADDSFDMRNETNSEKDKSDDNMIKNGKDAVGEVGEGVANGVKDIGNGVAEGIDDITGKGENS